MEMNILNSGKLRAIGYDAWLRRIAPIQFFA
jgi:hypothetical protein